jgi:uncharacterized phage-associated protein
MTPQLQFDREKFKRVVHYICSIARPEDLGNVKLHKALYFADMLSFLNGGVPLTGVEYQKQKFGPVAKHLTWAIDALSSEGAIATSKRNYFGYSKTDYVALTKPNMAGLSNEEVALLNDVVDFVCAKSAREISELSHDVAWHKAKIGETIPYYAAYGLIPTGLSDEDISDATNEVRRARREIEAQRTSC